MNNTSDTWSAKKLGYNNTLVKFYIWACTHTHTHTMLIYIIHREDTHTQHQQKKKRYKIETEKQKEKAWEVINPLCSKSKQSRCETARLAFGWISRTSRGSPVFPDKSGSLLWNSINDVVYTESLLSSGSLEFWYMAERGCLCDWPVIKTLASLAQMGFPGGKSVMYLAITHWRRNQACPMWLHRESALEVCASFLPHVVHPMHLPLWLCCVSFCCNKSWPWTGLLVKSWVHTENHRTLPLTHSLTLVFFKYTSLGV